MRESKKTERMHLQTSSYEKWLETQTTGRGRAEPKHPPENVYEDWLERRVEKRSKRKPVKSGA